MTKKGDTLKSVVNIKGIQTEIKVTKFQKQFFDSNPDIEWPLCECGCGLPVLLNISEPKTVFRRYGSPECSRKSKTVPKDVLDKLSNKEWLYEQRVILKKSKETIAEELNVSTMPVNKWCKIHQIEIRLNESNSKTKQFLENKEWLYEQHVIKKRKCEEIANEIGSSKATVSIFLNKHGIPINNPNEYPRKFLWISSGCQEIIDYIKSIYSGEIVINDRSVLQGRELDIYLPDAKFAIEFNGVWSHLYRPNEENYSIRKDRTYHKNKTKECNSRGIFLFQIWSQQWYEKSDIIKSMISYKLNQINDKIYARKCIIKEIDVYTKNMFLDNNHLQGKDKSLYKYGLFYNDDLVSVMTITKSRFNSNYKWELSRFCNRINFNVIGAFTKLLTHFRKDHEGSIVSYADMMYSDGRIYKNNGFTLLVENPASYWYVKRNTEILEHRFKFRKNKIASENDDRTEEEIMDSLGYDRIYDCGTLTFVMK